MLSKIPEIMNNNSMSVNELSKVTGLSRTTLTPLAASNEVPSKTRLQTLLKISEALHVPLSRMVFESISMDVLELCQIKDDVNKGAVRKQMISIKYANEGFSGRFVVMSNIVLPSLNSFATSTENNEDHQMAKSFFKQLGVTKANTFMSLSMPSTSELVLVAKDDSPETVSFIDKEPLLNSDDSFTSLFNTVEVECTIKAVAGYFREKEHTTFSQITWDKQISAMPTIDKNANTELFFSTNTFDTEPRYRPSIL